MESIPYAEQIKALSKISKAIVSELYLEDILKLIVTVTAEVMGSSICSLMLLDDKTQKLVIRATQSVSEIYLKKAPLKIGEGIAGKVALENKPKVIKDVTKEEEYRYKDIAKKEGLRSLLCVPLSVKGKVIGVLNCYTSKAHDFTSTEIDVLTSVANQAAAAIENTELMVKSRVIQEELESRKLIERAKGFLMKQEGLNEEEAYQKLRKFSMDHRKSMREIAEAIILARQLEDKKE
ncbi:MAG: GAF and ANTAR domain-containing protein [Candidatus Omnitrophica bacterium]|nr:GAF and ANTAR domain-containing protein [Candidatus Omnitrophota bacterium]MDD5655088.1 GAF and ANTAR domain-containing protein [Candidatus Omnitrophota bacterium]